MVVVNLMGGLGNQLCMYAYSLALKQKFDYEIMLDSAWFDRYGLDCDNSEKRALFLNEFDIKLPIKPFSKLDRLKILPNACKAKAVINKIFFKNALYNPHMPIENTALGFDKNMLEIRDNSYVSGYFTSYEYFRDSYLDLRFVGRLDSRNLAMLNRIKSTKNSVALHIRRGDYLNIHGFAKLGKAYYKSAIDTMDTRLGDCHYFIFSNDVEFAKNAFVKYLDISHSIIDIKDNNPAFEMHLMSQCHHQIIANSTFSFWAALLNRNEGKIIIAPDRFAYDRQREIFPKDWIIINHLWGNILYGGG